MGEATQRPDRRRHIGRLGEDIAAAYIERLGWRVLDRNWRTRYGELDLIAADGDSLVVVEVKTRASRTFADPAEAITVQKLRRMRRLAGQWLSAQDTRWRTVRFDAVAIQLDIAEPEDLERARISHHSGLVE